MALSVYAANEGFLEDVEVSKILDFEESLIAYANSEHADLMNTINDGGQYNDDIASQMKAVIEKFKSTQTW